MAQRALQHLAILIGTAVVIDSGFENISRYIVTNSFKMVSLERCSFQYISQQTFVSIFVLLLRILQQGVASQFWLRENVCYLIYWLPFTRTQRVGIKGKQTVNLNGRRARRMTLLKWHCWQKKLHGLTSWRESQNPLSSYVKSRRQWWRRQRAWFFCYWLLESGSLY